MVSIYGWARQEAGDEANRFERTDQIVQALLLELAQWPAGPTLVMGDLNASATKLPSLKDALDCDRLIDLGARAQAWGGGNEQPTAQAHNARKPSRIDYILASPHVLSLCTTWHMHGFGMVDVHAPISIDLSVSTRCPVQAVEAFRSRGH